MDQCLNVQAETVIRPMDELFVCLKNSWFGQTNNNWSKTFQFRVDCIFEEEKCKKMYPLFDIVRLIQFSRSSSTKQCIRCGNYTESNIQTSTLPNSKINSIYLLDNSAENCICGGSWVFLPMQ